MAAQAPLQAGAQFQDLRADKDFMAAPPVEQVQYLLEDYLPRTDPDFVKAPQQEKLQYIQEAVMPQLGVSAPIKGLERPSIEPPDFSKSPQALADARELYGFGKLLKGASLGYLDPSQAIEQRFAKQGINLKDPGTQAYGNVLDFGASILPIEGIASGLNTGLKAAGRYLLPKTTPYAIAAGKSLPFARQALDAITRLQAPNIAAQAARGALEFGAYEGLKSQPENQLDLGQRATNAALGAAAGAAFPPLVAGAGKVLKGGVQAYRNLMMPKELPVGFAKQAREATHKANYQQLEKLAGTFGKLQRGEIDPALVDPDDYVALVTKIDEVSKAIQAGKRVKDADIIGRKIEIKAQARAKKVGKDVQKRQSQQPEGQQPTQGAEATKPESQPAEQPQQEKEVKPQKTLTGSVQEMVAQGLEDFGGTLDEAKTLIAKVKALGKADDDPAIQALKEKRKALGNKRDDATKEAKAKIDAEIQAIKDDRKALRDQAASIHPNLREVMNTGWDGKSPVAEQLPIDPDKQKTFEQVKQLLQGNALKEAEKLDEAMQQGFSARVEHEAEITGSTDAAAKVTTKGNVKVPVSTYTPTHWTIVKKGEKEYPAAMGYNQAGYQHLYYPESPEGSSFKVKGILKTEETVGTTPNVYLGQRKYKVADVLGRAPEGEGVITSEAMTNAQVFANLFKSETLKQFSPEVQKLLRAFNKRGKFDEPSINELLRKLSKNKDDLSKFCNLFNLKVGS